MKKVLIALLVLVAIAGLAGTGFFAYSYYEDVKEKDILVKQNGELQSAIDAIGPVSTVYTVKADVFAGKEIEEDDLIEQTIPVSSINENYILDKKELVGKYYKVSIKPGTSLTSDVVMKDEMPDTVYERNITFDYLPLGIKVGDYIDIRMVLPYGEEFIVMQRKRVESFVLDTNTVTLKLTEAQLALWTSASTDLSIWKNKGMALYVTKYREPGLNDEVLPYYPVRLDAESTVTLNPNITNKGECINTKIRKELDKMLSVVTDEEGASIAAGRAEEAASINSAKETYIANLTMGITTDTSQTESNESGQDKDSSNQESEDIQLDPVDSKGNTSSITSSDEKKAEGDDLYKDEDIIE